MKETWRLAIRNLQRNRRRNAATALAIASGFAALLALGGYTLRARDFLRTHAIFVKQTGHLAIYQKDGFEQLGSQPAAYSLSQATQEKIAQVLTAHPAVDFFGGQLTGSGLVGNGCKSLPYLVNAISPELDARIRHHPDVLRWAPQFSSYRKGKPLNAYPDDYGAVALSEGLAQLLGKNRVVADFAGQGGEATAAPLVLVDCQSPQAKEQIAADANVQLLALSWDGNMVALDGEVVAHYSTGLHDTNSSSLFTSLAYLQKLYDTKQVSFISVWLKDRDLLPATMAELKREFAATGLALDLYRWDDELLSPMYTGTMDFLLTMVSFIAFILAIIIIFSVFNATTITIIERTQEIGMMRSLGYTRARLRQLYLQEAVVLTLLAIAAGGALALVCFFLINKAHIMFHPPGIAGGMQLLLSPNLSFALAAAAGIFVLALLTTLLAIYSATQRSIPQLLSGALR